MSRKYKFADNDRLYFISFAVVYWIDLFVRREYKDIVLESWRYCQREKELDIYAWCIMPSHVHMIIGSKGRPLDKIVGEMKSYTSRMLRKAIAEHAGESRREWMVWLMEKAGMGNSNNNEWQLWQQHNKPIELLNEEMFYQKMEYIHRNPVEAGFVENEEDYLHSSARDFFDKKGLVELSYVV
ncbi:MAG: transposase [Bacteroidetes bacterium]|nr:transposase [Bacteroidota bacterium]MBS1541674.1 transposase [Bacteroidota bacterium]